MPQPKLHLLSHFLPSFHYVCHFVTIKDMLEDAGTQKSASLNMFVLFLQVGACGLVFIPVSSII